MKDFIQFIEKVQSIAKIGKTYSHDPYALENYEELEKLSMEMLSKFTTVNFERPNYFEKNIYPTPNVSVRTVVFKEGKVAWVKEEKNGKYSLPGGWADLWVSPAGVAIKECREELGAEVKIKRLIGVIDRSPYKPPEAIPDYTIIFEGEYVKQIDKPCHEILAVEFYDMDIIPEVSRTLMDDEIKMIYQAIKDGTVIYN